MGLRGIWGCVAIVALAALGWGWSVGRERAPARSQDQTLAVDAGWYANLPLQPAAATAAYLARIPADTQARGAAYSDTRLLALALRVLSLLAATAFLIRTRLAARARDQAARLFSRPLLIDSMVALQYFVALLVLTLPADIYWRFVRQHRFGFSDQAFVAWLGDQLTESGVFTLFYLVAVAAIYYCVRRRPTRWVASAVAIYVVLRALYTLLAPGVIEPLTNQFKPLPAGPQRQQILALAHANGIVDAAVVTGDASRQTRLLNAHVSGFAGTARISVDDNTLRSTSDAMLRAVVAHEIGHYVLYHEAAAVVTDSLSMALGFLLIGAATERLIRRGGARWQIRDMSDIAGLPVFWSMFLAWGYLSLPLSNAISRVCEHQADLFSLNAAQEPHGLAEFMIHDADTQRLRPTRLEYALFFTHPSDAERVEAAMQWRAGHAELDQAASSP